MAPATRNSTTRQSAGGTTIRRSPISGGKVLVCRVDNAREHEPRNAEGERSRDQCEHQALGEQLRDDAAPRRANGHPDTNLPLACNPASEQQVGDVRATDDQDEAERQKERHEQHHGLGGLRNRAQPRFEHEARGGSLAGTFDRTPRIPQDQLRKRLIARQARLEPSDDVEATEVLASLAAGTEVAKERERCPVVRRDDLRVLESPPASRRQRGKPRRSPGPCG